MVSLRARNRLRRFSRTFEVFMQPFLLASGVNSPIYWDMRKLLSDVETRGEIINKIADDLIISRLFQALFLTKRQNKFYKISQN